MNRAVPVMSKAIKTTKSRTANRTIKNVTAKVTVLETIMEIYLIDNCEGECIKILIKVRCL